MEISERIRSWRKAKGKTLREVAEKLGVTVSAISYWESGTTKPTTENLETLVETFGLSMAQFYGPVPKPKKPAKKAHRAKAAVA